MEKENAKLTKNQKRRNKKKEDKKKTAIDETNTITKTREGETTDDYTDVEVEYISASTDDAIEDPLLDQFKQIFLKFATPEELTSAKSSEVSLVSENGLDKAEIQVASKEGDGAVEEPKKLSKKKKKLMSRLSVAELKQLVPRPDVVEAHDVTAADPRLLVYLKAYRNTVPIPRHWCHKRKYLQGKRGVEKAPFELPEFIAETGIAKIRESVMEQEALKKSKQKARDRLTPKMGKIDIDYQVSSNDLLIYSK